MIARRYQFSLLLLLGATVVAQDKSPTDAPKPGAPGKAVVDVYLAAEHAPTGLKSGDKVVVLRVNGKTVTRKGRVAYTCAVVVPEATAVGVVNVEKPKSPEQAVKVQLQTTKDQAALIERVKTQTVTTYETSSDGRAEARKSPVTLRLEFPKEQPKKIAK